MWENIYCHDGSLGPMKARQNRNGAWEIFGVSEVRGMGDADYENNLFETDFEELVLLNSFRGIAYVCMKKHGRWGLLEIRDNKTVECEWKIISDFQYSTVEELLDDFKINIELFWGKKLSSIGRF